MDRHKIVVALQTSGIFSLKLSSLGKLTDNIFLIKRNSFSEKKNTLANTFRLNSSAHNQPLDPVSGPGKTFKSQTIQESSVVFKISKILAYL